jgi:hypothetical protein
LGSNRNLAAQTLFWRLKQKYSGSNIVFWKKTMFEGMGRKDRGGWDEIREKTPGIPPLLQSTGFLARKPRNFTDFGNQGRFSPPAPAIAALICRAEKQDEANRRNAASVAVDLLRADFASTPAR